MISTDALRAHIATCRRLLAAAEALDRAAFANRELTPRTGMRGGRATTLNARHDRAAEEYGRLWGQARDEAGKLWGG